MEQDLERELNYHLDRRTGELRETGLSESEARRRAAIELGGVAQVQEEVRDTWWWRWLHDLAGDVWYSLRMLAATPRFTATAVLSLALGIGANTAIFTLIDAVMLKMLPVKNPQELVMLRWAVPAGRFPMGSHWMNGSRWPEHGQDVGTSFSYPTYQQIQARGTGEGRPLSSVFAFTTIGDLNVFANGEAALAPAQIVSANYFSVLGVNPVIGRTFVADDDQPGATPVCVISDRYWKRRFSGDPSIVGRAIVVNGAPVTVIGVTPPEFFGLQPGSAIEMSLPLSTQPPVVSRWDPKVSMFTAADHWWVLIMGRLSPAISERQAASALDMVFKQSVNDPSPGERAAYASLELAPGSQGIDDLRRQFSRPLLILMGMVGMVLLIACVNVANMLLARATQRQREIGIRVSIGATRGRLIRQFLTESVLLACLGGAVGFALAWWGSRVLTMLISRPGYPIPIDLTPDLRILAFAAGTCLGTGLLFGLVPAFRATRLDMTPALNRSTQGFRTGASLLSLGKTLVVAQTTLSVILLFGAGLFVRTLVNLQSLNTGFDQNNLLLFGINASQAGYKGQALNDFYGRVQQRLSAVPGVFSATASLHLLLSGHVRRNSVWVPGYTPKAGEDVDAYVLPVGRDFFKTMRIPLLGGRDFTDRDNETAPKVAVVNEAFVKRYFADQDPIGQRIGWSPDSKIADIEIVGVAKDAKYSLLRMDAPATVYHPFPQAQISAMHFEVRTAGDPKALVAAVRHAVASLDHNIPLYDLKTQTDQIDELLMKERLFAKLSSSFGLLALVLACVGLYGVLSYAVARRTGEIGIRVALGAQREDIVGMVLREALLLVAIGLALGVPLSLGAARLSATLISDLLYGLKPNDLTSVVFAAAALIIVAAFAGFLPALRASRVDPMTAIRYE